MNLVLSFAHPRKAPKSAGTFRAVRLDGRTVREAREGEPIAVHRDHHWELGGERYFRLEASGRLRVHFERPPRVAQVSLRSRDFGPFQRFSAIDGVAYTDERLFAFVDPKVGDWFCYEDGHHWAVMVVSDAGSPEDRVRSLLGNLTCLAPLVPGVIALWQGASLLYLARAESLRAGLERLARGHPALDAGVTAVTWEAHANAAAREAELLAEYERASPALVARYGLHGSLVRTARLVERAKAAVARAAATRARARELRRLRRAAA